MVLNTRFRPAQGEVMGTVQHTFKVLQQRVDTLFFDAPGIRIQSALLDGQPVAFDTSASGVTLRFRRPLVWDNTHTVEFAFQATPRKGLYFTGWQDASGTARRQIWTQGQGIDHRYWFPCYDDANDKLITETITTFETGYEVLSNGTLAAKTENADGTTTWHYRMTRPHSVYLLMLGIGKYKYRDLRTQAGVPVRLYYYPDHEDRFDYIYAYSTECIDFLAEHTGIPYPWESYSQIPVQDFIYGAMENTTATIFGDFFCVDARGFLDRNYIGVNVHELTHQWFGDLITHRASKDIWLHESFATFYPKLFTRKIYGQDAYQWQRRGEQNAALAASVTDNHPIRSTLGGTSRWYPKGSAVLDMMLYTFGEDQYRRVINYYLRRHAYRNVETNDLYQAFQDTLGLTPDWFFDQWVLRGGEPHYRVRWEDVSTAGGRFTDVHIEQVHPLTEMIHLFKMPVVLQVHYADGETDSVRVMIENQTSRVRIPNGGNRAVSFVLFDPGSYIIKKLTFEKSFDELRAQALRAPMMIDRYDAVAAMRSLPVSQKLATLLEVYQRETFHAIKAEIVQQLANEASTEAIELLRLATTDRSKEVREAVATNLRTVPEALRPAFEGLLQDSSYAIVETALRKLCEQFPANTARYRTATQSVLGMGHNVRIANLEMGIVAGDRRARSELALLASNRHEFRTRTAALQALQRLNWLDAEVLPYVVEAYLSPNRRLGGVAGGVLKHFWAQHSFRSLIRSYYNSHKANLLPWQAELWAEVLGR
jgi:aminopeptidase N